MLFGTKVMAVLPSARRAHIPTSRRLGRAGRNVRANRELEVGEVSGDTLCKVKYTTIAGLSDK